MLKVLILLGFLVSTGASAAPKNGLDRNQFEVLSFEAPYLLLWEKYSSSDEDPENLCLFEEDEFPGRRIHLFKLEKKGDFQLAKSFELRSDRVQAGSCDSKEQIQTRLKNFRDELKKLPFSAKKLDQLKDNILLLGSEQIATDSALGLKELQFNLPYISSLICQNKANEKCQGEQWIHHQNFDYFLSFKAKTSKKKTSSEFLVNFDFKMSERPKQVKSPKEKATKPTKNKAKEPAKKMAQKPTKPKVNYIRYSFQTSHESRHGMELSPVFLYLFEGHLVFFARTRVESFGDRQTEKPQLFAMKLP